MQRIVLAGIRISGSKVPKGLGSFYRSTKKIDEMQKISGICA